MNLRPYTAELPLGSLVVGVDNIHHDVYLSPQWTEQTRTYLLELIRQITNLTYMVQTEHHRRPKVKKPEPVVWKRQLLELLQASLTRAKYEKKIELDLLLRVALIKFLTQEISTQFSSLLLEAKEWIRNRGEYFERSEQAHVMKARLAELQADRRNIYPPGGPARLPDPDGARRKSSGARASGPVWRRAERSLRVAFEPPCFRSRADVMTWCSSTNTSCLVTISRMRIASKRWTKYSAISSGKRSTSVNLPAN